MNSRKFIQWQWRGMRWSWFAMLIVLPAIVTINFAYAVARGEDLPWMDLLGAIGIAIWATAIMWLARRWFNFMLGGEECKWRGQR